MDGAAVEEPRSVSSHQKARPSLPGAQKMCRKCDCVSAGPGEQEMGLGRQRGAGCAAQAWEELLVQGLDQMGQRGQEVGGGPCGQLGKGAALGVGK